MNNVTKFTLDELGDSSAEPGSRPWAIWVRDEIASALHDVEFSAEHLQLFIKDMQKYRGYTSLGFESFDEFCESTPPYGLGKSKIEIHVEIENRNIVQQRANRTLPLLGQGGDRKNGHQVDNYQVDNYQASSGSGGTSAAYLAARIARDNPDVLERMKAGEFRSVRQAAIAAGIPQPIKRITIAVDSRLAARQILKHFTPEQIKELIAELEA